MAQGHAGLGQAGLDLQGLLDRGERHLEPLFGTVFAVEVELGVILRDQGPRLREPGIQLYRLLQ